MEKEKRITGAEENPAELMDAYEDAVEKVGGRAAITERFGDVTIKLNGQLDYMGETIRELHLNFLGLTGLDMEIIDDKIGALGLRGLLPAYSRKYQRMLAARAADVPEDLILRLPLVDYNAVVNAAQNFLLITG